MMKIFCQVQGFAGVIIDENLICESVGWLYENQRGDGAFPEVGRRYFSRGVTVRIVNYPLTVMFSTMLYPETYIHQRGERFSFISLEYTFVLRQAWLALSTKERPFYDPCITSPDKPSIFNIDQRNNSSKISRAPEATTRQFKI